jgi:aerobic carbon-monoxide dehydrogenase small subunit
MKISVTINDERVVADIEPRLLLVHFLREHRRLTGTHIGCDTSQCGACTVLYNGRAVKSCSMLAVQADGAQISTIEHQAVGHVLNPLQQAFQDEHGLQCGFCTPGMVMTLTELELRGNPMSDEELRDALEGNRCRCTGYQNILRAARRVVPAPDDAVGEAGA